MIIDIALGIVLAVLILRFLPAILATTGALVMIAVLLAIVAGAGYWVFKHPGETGFLAILLGGLILISIGAGAVERLGHKKWRIKLGEVFTESLEPIVAPLLMIGFMVALTAILVQNIRRRFDKSAGCAPRGARRRARARREVGMWAACRGTRNRLIY